ncbi:hypothetical protein Pse7367_1029 [Thalassoporum mexicanum PCC 7367]|uniref:hypothetical protein n=1 Tax=Thalassoporum mexicanum TaxID=3457544 RepID=UPI00029F9005|nr:hypothetical protein [Pseudanabaena sp. PCC 7367]AFY69327.1 hypothetical protein Pse7367_1029 [Pseudanabaena sp. PCC 7367]
MLKPQDIVVLLKLYIYQSLMWTYSELADELYMSSSVVHASTKRCIDSGLYDMYYNRVMRRPLYEVIVYGVKYIFYTQPGKIVRGIPTAHSAEPLKSKILDDSNKYVWASPDGWERGQEIKPLYKSVPKAVKKDPELYALLSLVDAIRVGKRREYQFAVEELKQRLGINE